MTPLDVVKIRLQAQQKALLSNKCYLYCNGLMEHLCPCGETAWIPRRVHFHGTIVSLNFSSLVIQNFVLIIYVILGKYISILLIIRLNYIIGKNKFI